MTDSYAILVVVTTLLVTSFTCIGLLAMWAATSPRHWLLRCAAVLAVLSPLVLIPAYQPWGLFALQACTVAAGITIWRWRAARRQEDSDPENADKIYFISVRYSVSVDGGRTLVANPGNGGGDTHEQLILRIKDGTISGKIAKTLFEQLWEQGGDVDAIIEAEGLTQVSDSGEISGIIEGILNDNPAQVEQFKAGKEKMLGFFVGQVMKATQGKANPQVVNQLLREALNK